MTQTLEERIEKLKVSVEEIDVINEEGEEFDLSIPIENQREGLIIIKELQEIQEIMRCKNQEIEELKKQNKSWKEMVDSTNQTTNFFAKD